MSEETSTVILPVGTQIRFTQTLEEPASGEHPHLIYAERGELGEITGHGTREGYWVKTDSWPNAFGAARDEFEAAKESRAES